MQGFMKYSTLKRRAIAAHPKLITMRNISENVLLMQSELNCKIGG